MVTSPIFEGASLAFTPQHPLLSTAAQLQPEQVVQAAQAGFAAILNNRPDFEHGAGQPTAQAIAEQAQAHGLAFFNLPFSPSDLNERLVVEFARMVGQAPKPLLVYCRSGARSAGIFHMALDMGYLAPEDLMFLSQ